MQELLRTDKMFKSLQTMSRGSAARTRNIVYGIGAIIVTCELTLHLIDRIAGWIAALIIQVLFLLSAVFTLVILMEYQDRQGYEAQDVERIMNPVFDIEVAIRVSQILGYLYLGSYWMALLTVPFLVFDLTSLRPVRRIDSTKLWKDIQSLLKEWKIKLAANCLVFFVTMFAMILAFIRGVTRD
jgi:hypothetical protein